MGRDVHVAIMKAARSGKGLRLTAEEARALSFDGAIEMVEKAARGLARRRIMLNLRWADEPKSEEFIQSAENVGWRNFEDEARAALLAALQPPD